MAENKRNQHPGAPGQEGDENRGHQEGTAPGSHIKNREVRASGLFAGGDEAAMDPAADVRNAILLQSPRGGRIIIWMTFLFFVAFIVWAANSEVEEVTRGMGKVIPSRQIQKVQNLEGGILSEILVDVGDVVDKGQLLLRIDKTRFSAPYQESRVNYLSLLAKIARLEAEIHDRELVIPEEVQQEDPKIGRREEELFASRKEQLRASLGRLEQQLSQRRQQLAEAKTHLSEVKRTYRLLRKELEMTRPLVKAGAVSEVELLRLQRQASELKGEIETTTASIPRLEAMIREARQAIEEERLKFVNQAKEELNDAYARLESLSATASALEDRLRRTEVRSPVRGTVNRILVNTIGGVIQPGMDLIEIVPLEDSLLIETRIKPSDIAFLHPGQKAMVKFTAYDFTIYGGLEATLEYISADSITDDQGRSFYLVRVRTKKNYLGPESDPLPIIPGMVATVDILTGKKTILSYLLKPMLRAKMSAFRER